MLYSCLNAGLFAVIAATATMTGAAGLPPVPGEIIYQQNFDKPGELAGWLNASSEMLSPTEGINGSGCLKLDYAAPQRQLISMSLDLKPLRGRAIVLEAMMKGCNISTPSQKYFGIKLMFNMKAGVAEDWQDHPDKRIGSFDWERFSNFIRIPTNAEKLNVVIGLQDCSGTLLVDDLKITMIPQVGGSLPVKAAAAGDQVQMKTRYRGVTIDGRRTEKDFEDLKKWGVNLVRYHIYGRVPEIEKLPLNDAEKYRRWLDLKLQELDRTLEYCRKNDLKVIIALFNALGSTQTSLLSNTLTFTPEAQDMLVWEWEKMAAKYKDNPTVCGYDILNEPLENNYSGQSGVLDWDRLAERVAKAIRQIDPVKPIIIEPSGYGASVYFLVDVPNVIYSVHFYSPQHYTHQGLNGMPAGLSYPGQIDNILWDKDTMRKALAPAIEFKKKYNVPMIVGEFSALRWAPGSQQYLKNAIEIFEENGWDWIYHGYREFHGWDAEWSADRKVEGRLPSTPRKEMLLEYFKRNQQ